VILNDFVDYLDCSPSLRRTPQPQSTPSLRATTRNPLNSVNQGIPNQARDDDTNDSIIVNYVKTNILWG
jgi:hypothetical protein